MKKTEALCVGLVSLVLAPIGYACDLPTKFTIPDGQQATADEMTKSGQQYHQFMLDMQLYQACLEDDTDRERLATADSSKAAVKAREDKYASIHNAASSTMTRTSEAFDRAVETYKARQ